MGFPVDFFLSKVEDELICTICRGVYESPKQISVCEHLYCERCLEERMETHGSCPQDAIAVNQSMIRDAPDFIKRNLALLNIKCGFASLGCSEIIKFEAFDEHRSFCPFNRERLIKCDKGCGTYIERAQVGHHNCLATLNYTLFCKSQQFDALLAASEKEVWQLKCQISRLQSEVLFLRNYLINQLVLNPVNPPPMMPISCLRDEDANRELGLCLPQITVIIHCRYQTFKCTAYHEKSPIEEIKHKISAITGDCTLDVSLFYNGIQLKDNLPLSNYALSNGSQLHLFPRRIYVKFNCLAVGIIFGLTVNTAATIRNIIKEVRREIQQKTSKQHFQHFCNFPSHELYLKNIRLEPSYPLANYDVFAVETLVLYPARVSF